MNINDLFWNYDRNGNPIYYYDEKCTKLYSGHIEEYDRGWICMEADVINGFVTGICKEYFFKSTQLELISYQEKNLHQGLVMEFFENGKVKFVTLEISNGPFEVYEFDENSKLIIKQIYPDPALYFLKQNGDDEIMKQLRQKFNLEKISEEIQRDGEDFDYGKYFKT